jgi:hypothetical protein
LQIVAKVEIVRKIYTIQDGVYGGKDTTIVLSQNDLNIKIGAGR